MHGESHMVLPEAEFRQVPVVAGRRVPAQFSGGLAYIKGWEFASHVSWRDLGSVGSSKAEVLLDIISLTWVTSVSPG